MSVMTDSQLIINPNKKRILNSKSVEEMAKKFLLDRTEA